MKIYHTVIISLLLNLFSISVEAALIEYEFSGTFNRKVVFYSEADVSVGDSFSGLFSYDEATPLFSIIEEGTHARYNTGNIFAESGSFDYSATGGSQLQIFDNWEFSPGGTAIDDFFLSVYLYDASGSGFYLLQLNMRDYTLSVLNDLSIPTTTQVEQLANNGSFALRRFSSNGVEEWLADGPFWGITLVPEPLTMVLLAFGGVAVARRRLWQTRKRTGCFF